MTLPLPGAGENFRNPPLRAAAFPISFPATAVDVQLATGDFVLTWVTFTESTGGATAVLQLIDGTDNNGQLVAQVNLNANESIRDPLGSRGIYCSRGVRVHVVSGTVLGAVAIADA